MERHGDSSHRLAATTRSSVFNALYVQNWRVSAISSRGMCAKFLMDGLCSSLAPSLLFRYAFRRLGAGACRFLGVHGCSSANIGLRMSGKITGGVTERRVCFYGFC